MIRLSRLRARLAAVSAAVLCLCSVAVSTSCIENDIPYPHIQANITDIFVNSQSREALIDSTACTVTVFLPEEADPAAVTVEGYTLTPGATVMDSAFQRPLNLLQPLTVKLFLYYPYEWTIIAQQTVERYFTVEGQIGATVIDAQAHRVIVTVSENTPLSALPVLSAKLGPKGSTVTPVLEGSTINLTEPMEVTVTAHGRSEKWTIYALVSAAKVTTLGADAWTNVAWVHGQGEAGATFGVQYRIKGAAFWTDAPASWLQVDGGSFTARLIHLSPNTEYEARTTAGNDFGATVTFTTGLAVQPPNMHFDQWWLDGKVWCPWAQGDDDFWGSGNKGATTLGPSNTLPSDDTPSGTGLAAELQTKFIGIGSLGKLAAGNIFTGAFLRTEGTNGVLSMGRPFTQRPTGMRGYLKYHSAPISSVSAGYEHLKGRPDTGTVWLALIDTPEPLEIRTKPSNRNLFDANADYVIAYGSLQYGEDINNYTPFKVNLQYRSTSRVPKYIIICASASKYGDFFTGGHGSVMFVDDFELLYDY